MSFHCRGARLVIAALGTALLLPALAAIALAGDPARDPVVLRDEPDLWRMKRARLMREARLERLERGEFARESERLRLRAGKRHGARLQPLPETREAPAAVAGPVAGGEATPYSLGAIEAVPTNVRVNNKTGNSASAVQAEQSIALWGSYGLCAWNNGQGYVSGTDTQGAAYTTNGGSTWTTVGIPHPAGTVANFWFTDPVVTVNEKTGEFYYTAITRPNGIAVVKGTFSGSTFTWGTPREVRKDPTVALLFDKLWLAADSLSGNLYLTYTTFGFGTDSILFQRSTDKGVNWGAPILMNETAPSFGAVQGSRPAVGDSGEVYVVWQELGFIDVDYMKIRKSVNRGVSFAAEDTVVAEFSNDGSGAPGYNRPNGFTFPSIAVDRTGGQYRGRVYVAWHEAVDFYDDPLGNAGAKSEVENNGSFATATPFTPGQKVRGSVTVGDLDYWSFSATEGTTYVFYCDSVPTGLMYELRIYCTDQATQLAYGGATDAAFAGEKTTFCWSAPSSGTYYLRMRQLGVTGNYRIQTGVNLPTAGEHAFDHRDAMMRWSLKGNRPWSPVWRMNTDNSRFDNWMPEIAVGSDGNVYGLWHDWRDAPAQCAGASQAYVGRSTLGGTGWQSNVIVSSDTTFWTTTLANIAPNQGDYNALHGTDRMIGAWADGRLGDADVYSAVFPVGFTVSACHPDTAVMQGRLVLGWWNLANLNPLFSNTYSVTTTNTRNWPMPPNNNVSVFPGSVFGVYREFIVPDTAAVGGQNTFCVTIKNSTQVLSFQCCFKVTVQQGILAAEGGPPGLALRGAWPNPARNGLHIAFTLEGRAPAALELLDLAGRRVLFRELGGFGAGPHVLDLSGDASRLRPGVYTIRLVEAGRSRTGKVAIVR